MKILYNLIKIIGILTLITIFLFCITGGGLYTIFTNPQERFPYILLLVPLAVIILILSYIIRIAAIGSLIWGIIKFENLKIYIYEIWQNCSSKRKTFDIICFCSYILTFIIFFIILPAIK